MNTRAGKLGTTFTIAALTITGVANASQHRHIKTSHSKIDHEIRHDVYEYEYRGREFQLVMPQAPGNHIKMRIEFVPVI